ncbi:MAG: tetratricopeptide repeat protein [Acidobacteriota bacterium]
MDRITRKELKTDKFALEVEHTVEYVSQHRKQFSRYGAIALAVVVLVAAGAYYRRHQRGARQAALNAALQIQNAPIGQTGNEFLPGYPSQQEKDKAALKVFTDLASRHAGSDEGVLADYYLGAMAADQGRLAEAAKLFEVVAREGNENYAALAKLSLAEIYRAQGKPADGEKLLRSLLDKPTVFVSKEHATLVLAQFLAEKRPEEARKLLEPLRTQRSAISRAALTELARLPAK